MEYLCSIFNHSSYEGNVPENALVLGNISRFDRNKNQLFRLEVFREILRYRPDAVLLLGGNDAGYLERVRARAAELNLSDRVRFIGPRDDVPRCLKMIDIYLVPSFFEGFSISLLEAQAAGCLCAASDGIPRDADMWLGRVLFLSLSCSAKEWADQIMENYSRLRPLRQNEIMERFIETGFEISASSAELRKIYESVKQ